MKISDTVERLIIKDYLSNVPNNEIVKNYNICQSTIKNIVKRNNIFLRGYIPLPYFNHNIFSEYNEVSCYWAGLILADGCITNCSSTHTYKLYLGLKENDLMHLKCFSDFIRATKDVIRVKSNGKNKIATISLSSKQIISDLYNLFDIIPRKTSKEIISSKIPYKYISHYIRGFMDGDGFVSVAKYKNMLKCGFCGTYEVLDYIRHWAYSNGVKLKKSGLPSITKQSNNVNFHSFAYNGRSAIAFLELIYQNSTEKTRLDRKYKIYKDYIDGLKPPQ